MEGLEFCDGCGRRERGAKQGSGTRGVSPGRGVAARSAESRTVAESAWVCVPGERRAGGSMRATACGIAARPDAWCGDRGGRRAGLAGRRRARRAAVGCRAATLCTGCGVSRRGAGFLRGGRWRKGLDSPVL